MAGNRRYIAEAVKQQWVTMSAQMNSKSIAQLTGSSRRTVNRVLRLSRLTGSVVTKSLESGRPRSLTMHDVTFLVACVERTPDIFLSELQSELREARHVEVSQITIDRTLQRHGYTCKRVSTLG
ncbi:hypothetical protein EDD15DRAFT_2176115 [Pisolithus albus]|nr:hypothetical protein EDD15DRAFT_2183125 [Pisolithus albus]KAI5985305.1 hypothetical protein EDD15DRAFT_2176115 [Pisolithus albus]